MDHSSVRFPGGKACAGLVGLLALIAFPIIWTPAKPPPLPLHPASASRYSRHRCIGPQNNIEGFRTRTCRFENLCYKNGTFTYFAPGRVPILFDKRHGMIYNFSAGSRPFASLYAHDHERAPFAPSLVISSIPADATFHRGSAFLWRHWSNTGNLGHLLWEELGAVFFTQRRFRDVDPSIQILHDRKVPTGSAFRAVFQAVLPAITDRPLRSLGDVAPRDRWTCFERLFVGGAVPFFELPFEQLAEGREESLMDYRDRVLQRFNVTSYLPRSPVILITHKTHSIYALKSDRHRVIANAVELHRFLTATYPSATIELVEWHRWSLARQLDKVGHASLLITPCGGVSMILPFLPDGAHAIVMDYLSDGKDENRWGYKAGESASMEIAFWNRFPHVTKYYYQINSQHDFEWDFPGATDPRNDASIRVDFTRMRELVDAAFGTMGYNTLTTAH